MSKKETITQWQKQRNKEDDEARQREGRKTNVHEVVITSHFVESF